LRQARHLMALKSVFSGSEMRPKPPAVKHRIADVCTIKWE